MSITEINMMMPWHLDALLQFRAEFREKLKEMGQQKKEFYEG